MTIHVIYASTSGNVEKVVETAAEVLRQAGLAVELHRAEQTPLSVITDNDTFILASSTWEHGVLNPFFQRLYSEMKDQDFTGKRAGFMGCGDRRYESVLFNEGIKMINRLWTKQGGQQLHHMHIIDGDPYPQLEPVKVWATEFAAALQ